MELRMKKKIVSFLLCTVLVLGMFAGCGRNPQTEDALQGLAQTISGEEETQQTAEISGEDVEGADENAEETEEPGDASGTASSSEVPSMEEEPIPQATIVMVGDMLLHTPVNNSGKQEDGSYNYDHLFTHVQDKVQEADLALVNQEIILSGKDAGLRGYPRFNGAYEVGDSLVKAGFDVILHATNHAMDMGKEGLLRCTSFWENTYPEISVVGIYDSAEDAAEICIREVNGIKIAILNYTYSTNGQPIPEDMPYAVDMWKEKEIAADLAIAREQADFIIVCPHWGKEYVFEEIERQRKWAQFLADEGVDLCIGTHPHVIEPADWVTGKDGNEMLVYYSIGNYVNATSGTAAGVAARMLGAMAEVEIIMDERGCRIESYDALPLVAHVEENGPITTYFMEDYTEELAERHYMQKIDPDNFSLETFRELFGRVFGELYETTEQTSESADNS